MSSSNIAGNGPGRRVAIRRDGEDVVAAFQPDDFVIFRGRDPQALRALCRKLKWEIVSDTAGGEPFSVERNSGGDPPTV